MNEPKLHLNENDYDDRMTKKSLKEKWCSFWSVTYRHQSHAINLTVLKRTY